MAVVLSVELFAACECAHATSDRYAPEKPVVVVRTKWRRFIYKISAPLFANLFGEELRLFPGRKVATFFDPVVIDKIVISALRPTPRGLTDPWEGCSPDPDLRH
jgi:hypothetical protein